MNYLMVIQPIEQYQNKEDFCMPLGIAYINGAMRAAGFRVDGINMMFVEGDPYQALQRKIRDARIDVLMCGGLTSEYAILKKVFDTAREANPEIILIGGGGGFTSEPLLFSELTGVDYAVIGEGELTNPELARALEQHRDPAAVPGIVYRQGSTYCRTAKRPVIQAIDDLPFPSYEGLAMEAYLGRQQVDGWYNYFTYYSDTPRLMPMMMSRSCPYNCSFCFHPIGDGYRARGLDNFFQELDLWIAKYRINGIALVDECFSMNSETVQAFCRRIKPYHIAWACQMRAEVYDREMIAAMRDSGCVGACFGIESMSQCVLDNMQKHLKQETIENALFLSYTYRVGAEGNLIFGAETETFQTVWESISWNRHHMAACHRQPIKAFNYIQTYPGSRYYEHACAAGLIRDKADYIRKGQWNLNITGLSDRNYGIIGEAARLLQHETRDAGTILQLSDQADGRMTLQFRCPHCGSVHTYHNLSRKHLKEGRIRNLGCRTCNGLADYVIEENHYPYPHYVTVDWLLKRYDTTSLSDCFQKRGWKRVVILGGTYAADQLIAELQRNSAIRICAVVLRKGRNQVTGDGPFMDRLPASDSYDVIVDAELVHFLWVRQVTAQAVPEKIITLEDILRENHREDMILVNGRDEEIGYGEKMDVHRKKLLHRAFSVFLFDRAAHKMLLQKRALNKYHSGGLWSNACCSHPRRGRTMAESLQDRLKEELGMTLSLRIVNPDEASSVIQGEDTICDCGKFRYEAAYGDIGENEIDHVYLYSPGNGLDIGKIAANPDEIMELKWISIADLQIWMQEKPQDFTVWFPRAFALACDVLKRDSHG